MPQNLAFADNSRLARNKTPKPRITKRVKDAIDAIVERGIAYNEAALEVGLTTRGMRLALERPHVLAYLRQQLKVLRDARGPRNFHRLWAIADEGSNLMAAVNAIRALELLSEEATARRTDVPTPGVVLNIISAPQPAPIHITPQPLCLPMVFPIGTNDQKGQAVSVANPVAIQPQAMCVGLEINRLVELDSGFSDR
jgi:hypothetical protein